MPSKGRPYTTTCKGEKVWVLAHSICLLEQEAESWPTFCSDIELLAQSKSKAIPERFCLRGSLTEAYLNSLYGTTLQRSGTTTQTHEAILNGSEKGAGNSSFVAGSLSLAKTSALPEAGPDWTAKGQGYGEKWLGLLGRFDPDSCSLKTAQLSLLEDSTGCCPTLPRWGLMLDGELYPQPMLEPFTVESASGYWPTPQTRFGTNDGDLAQLAKKCENQEEFNQMAYRASAKKKSKYWPTPTASASKGSSQNSLTRKDGRDRSGDRLDHAVMALENGRLNPEFCEWLMGWPIGQTELRPLGMDKYQEWRQQHSPCFTETKEAA